MRRPQHQTRQQRQIYGLESGSLSAREDKAFTLVKHFLCQQKKICCIGKLYRIRCAIGVDGVTKIQSMHYGIVRLIKHVWCTDFSWVSQFEAAYGDFLDLVGCLLSQPRVTEMFATTA